MGKFITVLLVVFFSIRLFGRSNTIDSLPGIADKTFKSFGSTGLKTSSNVSFRMRCMASPQTVEPLIVIDGIVYDYDSLGTIDPNNVENIYVLKESAASALYGCRAANGVIVILTKSSLTRKFIIKDLLDGSFIPGATISFTSVDKKDTIMTIANDSGFVVTNKLRIGNEYVISISAVGYDSQKINFKNLYANQQTSILMERDLKNLAEIVTVSYPIIHCRSTSATCNTIVSTEPMFKDSNLKNINKQSFKLFPNPIQQNNLLSIEYVSGEDEVANIRVVDMSGKLVESRQEKIFTGKNNISILIEPKWSKGVYIVDVMNEKNSKIGQQKLIIQ